MSTTTALQSAAWPIPPPADRRASHLYSILDFGATLAAADNAAAIQSAIDTAAAANTSPYAGGAAVLVPPGIWTTGQLVLKNRVALVGADGAASILATVAGATAPMIVNDIAAGPTVLGTMQALRTLRLNGAGGGAGQKGVLFDYSGARGTSEFNDPTWRIDGCHIENFTGDGIATLGRGAGLCANTRVWLCDGNGLNLGGNDSYFFNIDVGSSGLDGFLITGADNRVTSSKAWFSGRISSANSVGNGFHVGANAVGVWLTNCGGQDNARAGLSIGTPNAAGVSRRVRASNFVADSNDTAGLGVGGVEIDNCDEVYVDGTAWERGANTNHQQAALTITASAWPSVEVNLMPYGMTGGIGGKGYLTTGSVVSARGARVRIGVQGMQQPTVAAAGTLTPDPYLYAEYDVALPAGNITVANPAAQHLGQRMAFKFTQDGTGGRTVAWGNLYKMAWTPVTTAGKVNTVEFWFDGTNWIQVGGVVGI